MKQLDETARIDDDGHLYLLVSQKPDTFDPPGTVLPPAWKATGFFFEDLPSLSWPLSMFWSPVTIQFAKEATAKKIATIILATLGENWDVRIFTEEVRVGPYHWREKRMLRIFDPQGREGRPLNAGMEASTYARHPEDYRRALRDRLGL